MFYTIFLLYIATLVAGDFTPIAPGPGDSFAAGSPCTMKWEVGDWKNVTITLMSGSNSDMRQVTTVASVLDGSNPSLSPFTWTCPEVSPYSAIYFYQFTDGNDAQNSKWTTRFQITSPSGAFTPPERPSQPNDGASVPWGTGTLAATSSPPSSVTPTPGASSANANSNEDTSGSLAPYKARKMGTTVSPERQAAPTLGLPSDASAQSGGAAAGYSSARLNSAARSVTGSNWSPSLSVILVVSAISWIM